MRIKTQILLFLGIIFIGILAIQYWHYRQHKDDIKFAPILKDNEKEKIIVDNDRGEVEIIKRGQSEKIKEGVRKTEISIDDKGNVSVYAPNKGFCLYPGYSFMFADDKFYAGLDIQFAYWSRFGLHGGVGVRDDQRLHFKPYVGIGYNFPVTLLSNTSIVTGITNTKDLSVNLVTKW